MEAFKVFLIVQCLAAPSLGTDVDRIVGGDEADIKSVPYIGALLKMGQNWCGASLINYNTAVTAAHCVVGLHESQLSLRVGSSYYYKGGQEISIKQVITHEKYVSYDRGSMNYDVAILKLVESVKVQDAIPIPLAPAGRQYLPATSSLGIDFNDPIFRILDGNEAHIKDFPYVGAILKNGFHRCGSSLITNDIVVTSAHCIYKFDINQLSVRFGSPRWDIGGQKLYVKQKIIHECYIPNTHNYDVALLKLDESVKDVIPIPLVPAGRQYLPGTIGVVAGWGYKNLEAGSNSKILLKAELPVIKESECRKYCPFYNKHMSNVHICAGYMKGGKDSCKGDSGGPYVINGELAGIVSWGMSCGSLEHPGVYASVSTLGNWIRHHAGIKYQ